MEMEMVIIESLSMEERRNSSAAETSSEVSMAMGMVKPSLSSSSSLSIVEFILDLGLALLMPQHMEIEMVEAFMAPVDAKELEMMMVMLKPLDTCSKRKSRYYRGDMEMEMVLQQHMDV